MRRVRCTLLARSLRLLAWAGARGSLPPHIFLQSQPCSDQRHRLCGITVLFVCRRPSAGGSRECGSAGGGSHPYGQSMNIGTALLFISMPATRSDVRSVSEGIRR